MSGLLDNAIKFSKPGGKIILQARQRSDGACEISLNDTGAGIPESDLQDIFAPFVKGKNSERDAMPGTGMGLATSKMLMDLHGGSVSIDSVEGEGTNVTLVFPAQQAGRAEVRAA